MKKQFNNRMHTGVRVQDSTKFTLKKLQIKDFRENTAFIRLRVCDKEKVNSPLKIYFGADAFYVPVPSTMRIDIEAKENVIELPISTKELVFYLEYHGKGEIPNDFMIEFELLE